MVLCLLGQGGQPAQSLNPTARRSSCISLSCRVREAAMTSLMDLTLLLAQTQPALIEAHV